jgi:transcriptional regulator with XRE-family HTH domain/tetratricopeptide (TPR) repeat protein
MSRQRHSLIDDWQASQEDRADTHPDVHPDTHPDVHPDTHPDAHPDTHPDMVLLAAAVAAAIRAECEPAFGTTWIRAYRLALGITLADVVAQVRAWYEADGRRAPRFSETLLSAYEGGQKRPGPEYLHYLCAAYQADPPDLGFEGRCLCGRPHGPRSAQATSPGPAAGPGQPASRGPGQRGPAMPSQPALSLPRQPGPPRGSWPAESARAVPTAPAGPALAAVYGAAEGEQAGGSGPAGPAQAGEDDDDELRRMLIRQLAAAGCRVDGRFLGAVDRIRRRMDDALLGGTVSAAMLDAWEHAADGYGRQYMTVPALRLLCDVLLDLADVRRMCEERQPLEFSERLCRLAGQLAGLAGISMLDIGDHRLARLFFRTARTAADETGDRRLRAWVTAREALVPLYYGDPREAASLASSAADLAGRHLCAAAVMAPVTEARARARLASQSCHGRRAALSRARAVLDRAADSIADLPAEVRADTALGYTERQLYFHAGDTLVQLGDWREAQRAFGQAASLYPGAEMLDLALVALGQARCLLESGEPAAALARSRDTVLGLPPEHRTAVVRQVARMVGQAASERHPRLPALSEYAEALSTA